MCVLILSAAVDVLYKSIFSRLALRSVYAITVGVFRKIPFNYRLTALFTLGVYLGNRFCLKV